jgi:hypothetical protein
LPRPSHSSRFFHPHSSGWAVQIMELLIMKFSPLPCYLVPLRSSWNKNKWEKRKVCAEPCVNVWRAAYMELSYRQSAYWSICLLP